MPVPKSREPNGAGKQERVEELPPSKLGTKAHWDAVYERENRVFQDTGDEGEVWYVLLLIAAASLRPWLEARMWAMGES